MLLVDQATLPARQALRRRADRRGPSAQCPVDPSPVVEEEVDVVELRFRFGDAVVRGSGPPLIRMTQRRRLDAFLLDAARERGVEVREGDDDRPAANAPRPTS